MPRVVLQMGVTVDGYVAGPGGEGDWGLPAEHPDVRAWKIASLRQAGTHIMGRVTYEQMAGHWPNATGEYAEFMNKLPKVVFSKTLPTAGWPGSRIARGDLAEEIAALKGEPGGEIMAHGGRGRPEGRILVDSDGDDLLQLRIDARDLGADVGRRQHGDFVDRELGDVFREQWLEG